MVHIQCYFDDFGILRFVYKHIQLSKTEQNGKNMHLHPLCRPPVLSTQPATGSPQHTWHHRLLAWALGLAALLMLLPGWATAQTGTWSSTDPMGTARREHTATLLPSGKVLVAGGQNGSNYLASAELYDPDTNTWSSTGSMGTARIRHTATRLPSGKVLVAGGGTTAATASSPAPSCTTRTPTPGAAPPTPWALRATSTPPRCTAARC